MGSDKVLLPIESRTFLSHICEIVCPHFQRTVVVAADRQLLPDLPADVCIVRDSVAGAGPLAGLVTGLTESRNLQPDLCHIWLGSCDAPFVNLRVIDHMLETAHTRDAVVVRHAGRVQPLGGIYRTAILPIARQLVENGELRLKRLPHLLDPEILEAETLRNLDPDLAFLRNINTPEEYQRYIVND